MFEHRSGRFYTYETGCLSLHFQSFSHPTNLESSKSLSIAARARSGALASPAFAFANTANLGGASCITPPVIAE